MQEYQEARFAWGTKPGERSGEERWNLISPYVPDKGVVLDVGSNLGYFGLRISENNPDIAVVSLESDDALALKQRKIVASHRRDNIAIIQGRVSADVSHAWAETCDWLDLTLLLSVIHWFDEPASVVRDLSDMSARLIVEVPDSKDVGACGQEILQQWPDPTRWFEEITGRRCVPLGRVSRHTSDVRSHVLLIEGPVSRSPRVAYWGSNYEHPKGNNYNLTYNGEAIALEVRGHKVDYVPGVNLLSLMKLGRLVWPAPRYWIRSGFARIRAWPSHRDPLTHNMLWTPAGIYLIDGDDQYGDIQGFSAYLHFAASVLRWRCNRMTVEGAYSPHTPELWSRAKSKIYRVARSVLPPKARRGLKAILQRFQ